VTEEKKYTLEEARRELDRLQCMVFGHSFDHVVNGDGDLLCVVCSRCRKSWSTSPR
jgi:hypothetical protein